MAEEKRVKLGVDIGELSNQLVQINNVIEQNYQKALQGQSEYNKILEESLQLLQQQVSLVEQLGQQNQISPFVAPQSKPIGGEESDKSFKFNELVEEILADIDSIWEKFSSLTTPIKVEVVNTPLDIITQDSSGGGGGGVATAVGAAAAAGSVGAASKNGGGGNNFLGRGSNVIASAVPDPNYILASVAGIVGGSGIASVISKVIGEAEQRIKAAAIFQGATGGNMFFQSLHGIGIKDAEAYQKEAQYYPANINLKLSDLLFEKGYNVGGGTMESLLRAMREDVIQERYGTSSSELGVTYLTQLKGGGNIDSKKIRGYTEDYLKILIDLNQKQLETTGETNSLISGEIVAGIARTSENFEDPTILKRVVEGIQGGLMQAPSPQAEALQYWAMSQANPNADVWQMQLMKEDPFSKESRGYFSNYLGALLRTGSSTDVRFNVMNAFGLTAHQTESFLSGISRAKSRSEELYSRVQKGETLTQKEQEEYDKLNGYLSKEGTFDLTKYIEGFDLRGLTGRESSFNTNAGAQIRREAGRATAENEILLAKVADRLADVGEPIINFTNKAIEKTAEIIEDLSKVFGGRSIKDSIKEALEDFHKAHPDAKNLGAAEYTETEKEKKKGVTEGYKQNSINPNTNVSSHWMR